MRKQSKYDLGDLGLVIIDHEKTGLPLHEQVHRKTGLTLREAAQPAPRSPRDYNA